MSNQQPPQEKPRQQRTAATSWWILWASAVAAAAGFAVVYFSYQRISAGRRKRKLQTQKPVIDVGDNGERPTNRPEVSVGRRHAKGIMPSPAHRHALSSEELLEKLKDSRAIVELKRFDADRVQDMLRYLRGIEKYMNDYPLKVRVECSWWLLYYWSKKSIDNDSYDGVELNKDLDIARDLLLVEAPALNTEPVFVAKYISAGFDISQATEDERLLRHFFDLFMKLELRSVHSSVLYGALIASATLAQWSNFLEIRQTIFTRLPRFLDQVHDSCLHRPDSVDYSALGKLVEIPDNQILVSRLSWTNFLMSSIDLQLASVTGSNPAEVEMIRSSVESDFESPVADDSKRIVRSGAVASAIGFSSFPIPLAGIFAEERIKLFGYMKGESVNDIERFQFEEIELRLESPAPEGLWRGSYIIKYEYSKNQHDNNNAVQVRALISTIIVRFDMTIQLQAL